MCACVGVFVCNVFASVSIFVCKNETGSNLFGDDIRGYKLSFKSFL